MKTMTKRQQDRMQRFLPNGKPRYVRVYDNGGRTIDRYCVVFTGRYTHKTAGDRWVLFMNAAPFHPQGVCMHSGGQDILDVLPGRWGGVDVGRKHPRLGTRIPFETLPADCQQAVMQDYLSLWSLTKNGE